MKLCKAVRHDAAVYILKNKRLLFIPILFLFQCIYIKDQIFNIDATVKGCYLDYVFYCFQGSDPISKSDDVILPIFWLAELFLSLFITTGLIEKDLRGFGLQILIRENSKIKWWIAKCLTSVLVCLIYLIMANLTILVFCILNHIEISLHTTDSIMQNLLESDCFIKKTDLQMDNLESIATIYMMPFLTINALNFLQLFLSLIIKPIISFIITNCYVLLSAYIVTPMAIAGYAMLSHNSLYVVDGLNTLDGVCICILVTILSILFGCYIFKKKDIL